MRINIVLGPFLPALPGPAGAVEKCWQGMAQEFVKSGHSVTILERHGVAREPSVPAYLHVRGYNRPRSLSSALALDFLYSLRALAALPPADITITNTFFLPIKPLLALQKLVRRHAGIIVPSVARMPKGQVRLFGDLRLVLAVSNAVKHAIEAELATHRRSMPVCVVNNPVDTTVFRPPERPRAHGSGIAYLFAGRIAEEKGLELLIDAFRRAYPGLPQRSSLVIIGPHEIRHGGAGPDYLDVCRNKAKDLPIEFRPQIRNPAELASALQGADVFVYPSLAERGESFGIAPLEGMACGCLTIVSDLECFRDFVTHGETGFIFDHRTDGVANLTTALLRAAEDQLLRTRLQCHAALAAERFSYQRIAANYLTVFDGLLGKNL